MSRKSLVKCLSSIYIPVFSPWFPVFPPWFPAFPPWFPAFLPWFPAFSPWFIVFPPWFLYSHPYSPHSHPDSLRSHHFPHSVPWFSIPAFTDSLSLQRTHSDSSCEVACRYWNIFTDNYRKFWAYPFTYFIFTLLNSAITSTQLFVKIYMTFYNLKFKQEITNMILQMIKIISVTKGQGKVLRRF